MRILLPALVILTAFAAPALSQIPAPARAQRGTTESLNTLPIARTVADAEREGALFPRTQTSDSLRLKDLGTNGSADRRCIANTQPGPFRSGDFNVGIGMRGLTVAKPNKVPWVPLHDPSLTAAGLLVRGARVDSAATRADTLRFVELDYGWPVYTGRPSTGAFFPSSFTVPAAGTWLLVATAGNDWACVIVKGVPDPPG